MRQIYHVLNERFLFDSIQKQFFEIERQYDEKKSNDVNVCSGRFVACSAFGVYRKNGSDLTNVSQM